MNPILEIVVKLLASSALLTAFYLVLFRGKASYRACRMFLLCIPALSLVLSLVSIEGTRQIFSFSSLTAGKLPPPASATTATASTGYAAEAAAPVEYPDSEAIPWELPAFAREVDPAPVRSIPGTIPAGRVVAAVYLAAMLLLIAVIARQMAALRRLRRRAERQTLSGCAVWFSREVRSAFSVMRNIYVNADTPWGRLSIIINHEKEHIARRHYIDLAVMEFFTLLMWFDPFVWIVRRELRNVHEFEADRGTLSGGIAAHDYMMAILEETTGTIPVMANGIQSSMIKKRFLKMKTPCKIRLRALRSALTLPFVAVMLLFFAFRPAAEPEIAAGPHAAAEHSVTLPAPGDTEASDLPLPRTSAPRVVVAGAAEPDTIFISVPNGDLKIHGMAMRADTMQMIMNGDVSFGNFADLRIAMDSVLSSPEFKAKIAEMRNAFSSPEFKILMDSMPNVFSSPEFKMQMDSMRSAFSLPEFKIQMYPEMEKKMAEMQQRMTVEMQKYDSIQRWHQKEMQKMERQIRALQIKLQRELQQE